MNRKKKICLLSAILLSLAFAFPSFAGGWQQDMNGWWYEKDDGSWLKNGWAWVDGNHDGLAECYYFGDDGYVRTEYGHVDGYEVNEGGAWTVNGEVQMKEVLVPGVGTRNRFAVSEEDTNEKQVYHRAIMKNYGEPAMDLEYQYRIQMEYEGNRTDADLTIRLKASGFEEDGNPVYCIETNLTKDGETSSLIQFYTDGYIYMFLDGLKVKGARDEWEMQKIVQSALEIVEASRAFGDPAVVSQENGNTVIDFDVDVTEIGTSIDGLMGDMAETLIGYSYSDRYEVSNSKGRAVIGSDGYITSEEYDLNAVFYNDRVSGTVRMKAECRILYHQPGGAVEVSLPSLEGYDEV